MIVCYGISPKERSRSDLQTHLGRNVSSHAEGNKHDVDNAPEISPRVSHSCFPCYGYFYNIEFIQSTESDIVYSDGIMRKNRGKYII